MKYSAVYGLISLVAAASAQVSWQQTSIGRTPQPNDGKDTVIYYLDSGVSGVTGVQHLKCSGCTGVNDHDQDDYGHGTLLAQIGRHYAPAATLKSVKIANDGFRFPLANVLEGIRTVINDNVQGRNKIINLSLSRIRAWGDCDPQKPEECECPAFHATWAITNATCEAAVYNNIHVVYAAGNNGFRYLSIGNPCELTTSAHTKQDASNEYPIWAFSDVPKYHQWRSAIFAPAQHAFHPEYSGTSFSASYVSAALATVISQESPNTPNNFSIKNRPFKAMRHLMTIGKSRKPHATSNDPQFHEKVLNLANVPPSTIAEDFHRPNFVGLTVDNGLKVATSEKCNWQAQLSSDGSGAWNGRCKILKRC